MEQSKAMSLEQIREVAPSALAVHPHESRSDRYLYIPTLDVIRGMQDAGFFPVSARESKARDLTKVGYTKHMVRFRNVTERLTKGDTLAEVVLINSHDGSCAYILSAGLLRCVCDNQMCVPDGTVQGVHIRHSGNLIEEVVTGSRRIMGELPEVVETSQRWQTIDLTPQEQDVFAQSAHTLRFGDSQGNVDTTIKPSQLLQARRSDDNGSDLWHTFNRIQENALKGGLRGDRLRNASGSVLRDENGRRVPRERTREIKGIDQDVRLNKALWQLAESMAKLKS